MADDVRGSYATVAASVAAHPSEEVEALETNPKPPPEPTPKVTQSSQPDNLVAASQSSTVTPGQRPVVWESSNFGDAEEEMQSQSVSLKRMLDLDDTDDVVSTAKRK